jgi:hypothetical protein
MFCFHSFLVLIHDAAVESKDTFLMIPFKGMNERKPVDKIVQGAYQIVLILNSIVYRSPAEYRS